VSNLSGNENDCSDRGKHEVPLASEAHYDYA